LRSGVAKSDDDDAKEAGNVLVEQGLLARYNSVSMLERRDAAFGAKADENFLKVETALGTITNAVIDANLVPQFKEFTKLETDYRKSVRELMSLPDASTRPWPATFPPWGTAFRRPFRRSSNRRIRTRRRCKRRPRRPRRTRRG